MKKTIAILFVFLSTMTIAFAQVTSVNYLIEYNTSTTHYDVKLVILEGSAVTFTQRVQFNSQYSIVVPTGAQLTFQESFNPLEDNFDLNGTVPTMYNDIPPSISPPTQPENDFYAFTPVLSPPSAYNILNPGDTVVLFSVFIDVDPCENSVRMFENGQDPSSIDMPNGGDYSNGFTLGSAEQIYDGNISSSYNGGVFSASLDDFTLCNGDCIDLTPEVSCGTEDLTYLWSTGEETATISVCPTETTTYSVEITDSNNESISAEGIVTVITIPTPMNVTSNSPLCDGEDLFLYVDDEPMATYLWTGPNGFASTDQNPIIPNA
ncbi:MAG: hypothetical protein P1U56_25720, partial [Saprospiraceae bacterium]|nr:hypothetical protein [Saprospiraceae bacterium]